MSGGDSPGQGEQCRAHWRGQSCPSDALGTVIRALPAPGAGIHRANLPWRCRAGPGLGTSASSTQRLPGQRQGRAAHTSQPQWSFYLLRTKANIPTVPRGRDKGSASITLFSIRGDASTQNIESLLEPNSFVSLIPNTFPTQLSSSCCKLDFYKIPPDLKSSPLNL